MKFKQINESSIALVKFSFRNLVISIKYVVLAIIMVLSFSNYCTAQVRVGDNLGNHRATDTLRMQGNPITGATLVNTDTLKAKIIADSLRVVGNTIRLTSIGLGGTNKDSLLVIDSTGLVKKYNIYGVIGGMLGSYVLSQNFLDSLTAVQSRLDFKLSKNDTLSLSNRINQRVNYSDSISKYVTPSQLNNSLGGIGGILGSYVLSQRFLDSLTAVRSRLDYELSNNDTLSLSSRINQRVNYSDSTIKYITPSQLHDSLVLIATGTNFPASTGDVKGPAANTDGYIALWKGTNSKTLQNGVAIPAGGLAGLDALSALNITVNSKLARNVAITGATKTKITYDANGLVISGADATTADIITSYNKRYVTDSQLVVIQNTSGINTGNETQATIKTKLGKASGNSDGYLTAVDWNIFNSKAPLASPIFTGIPTAPTASASANNNQLATTAFVNAFVNSAITIISVPDASTLVKGKIKLAGDLTGTADIPKVVSVGGSTASNINTATIAANAATDLLKNNTIVKRDGTGNFSADTITATLNGNATNLSGIVSVAHGGTGINAATIPANYIFASPSSGTGVPTFRVLTVTDLPDLTGKYLPLTGGILTGTLKVNNSVTAVRYLATGVDLSPSGSSLTIDLTKGNVYNLTLKNNVTINVSNNTGSLPASYIFKLIYNISTPITITWPTAFKWSNGTIPTLTNVTGKTDILSIFFDGTNYYYCSYALNF